MSLKIQETYPYNAYNIYGNAPAVMPTSVFEDRQQKKPAGKADSLDTAQKALYAGGIVPTVRRLGSMPDTVENHDWLRAGTLLTLAAANFPGDFRELERAGVEAGKLFRAAKSGENLKEIFKLKGQHEMTAIRGTVLEPLANKYNWVKKLDDFDGVLYNTKFGKFIRNTFNISKDHSKTDFIKRGTQQNVSYISTYQFNGNYAQQLTGRVLHRISKVGLLFSAALEIPALVRSITQTEGTATDKAKAFGKQLIKSAGYVGFVNLGIAVAGAILAPHTYIGALAAMAVGSAVGIMASKGVNKLVDKHLGKDVKKQEQKNPFIPAYTA